MHKTLILTGSTVLIAVALSQAPSSIIRAQDDIALPAPTGTYPVGQADYYLTDETRQETFTDDPDDLRELQLTVYYPADPAPDTRPAHYIANEDYRALVAQDFQTGFLDDFYAHAYRDAPLAPTETGYPVLIFSPGLFPPPVLMSYIAEELASQGYLVVGMWHPYSTGVTLLPDGRLAMASLDLQDSDIQDMIAVRVEDTLFVIDQLAVFNDDDSLLAGSIDLSRIGIYGWSVGGATAVYALQQEPRLLAGVMLDHTYYAGMNTGLDQPVLFMFSDNGRLAPPFADSVTQGYAVTIGGTVHLAFSDLLFLAPRLVQPAPTGSVSASRVADIVRSYMVTFFDAQLKGDATPLFDGALPDIEDVTFESLGALAE